MSNVEAIEQQIEKLSPAELVAFRSWYAAFDAEAWDREFDADAQAGKLDAPADKALRAHTSGQSTTFRLIMPHRSLVLLQRPFRSNP